MEQINDVYCIESIKNDSNSYLIEDILIDTGTGENKEYLFSEILKTGIRPEDINTIVNTHCHYDHVGGNNHFPTAKIMMHEKDSAVIENKDNITSAAFLFNHDVTPFTINKKLKDGDKVLNFEVIHTPGHTMGSICLYDGEILISGDTAFSYGGFGRTDLGGDLDELQGSLKRISELDVKYLLPGHGKWINNGKKSLELSYRKSLDPNNI